MKQKHDKAYESKSYLLTKSIEILRSDFITNFKTTNLVFSHHFNQTKSTL